MYCGGSGEGDLYGVGFIYYLFDFVVVEVGVVDDDYVFFVIGDG